MKATPDFDYAFLVIPYLAWLMLWIVIAFATYYYVVERNGNWSVKGLLRAKVALLVVCIISVISSIIFVTRTDLNLESSTTRSAFEAIHSIMIVLALLVLVVAVIVLVDVIRSVVRFKADLERERRRAIQRQATSARVHEELEAMKLRKRTRRP